MVSTHQAHEDSFCASSLQARLSLPIMPMPARWRKQPSTAKLQFDYFFFICLIFKELCWIVFQFRKYIRATGRALIVQTGFSFSCSRAASTP